MSEHTPGPWTVHVQKFGSEGQFIETHIWSADRQLIHWINTSMRPSRNDEYIANARLIAAAPELLEALEELVNVIYDYELFDNIYIEFDKARQAIAKAKGDV
jgi:hypothetical protein